eukprot:358162-Chlamydomonas_euryale.AAC.5
MRSAAIPVGPCPDTLPGRGSQLSPWPAALHTCGQPSSSSHAVKPYIVANCSGTRRLSSRRGAQRRIYRLCGRKHACLAGWAVDSATA